MNLTPFALILCMGMAAIARGDDPKPNPVLPGRPDARSGDDAGLGKTFESLAAGISLRPPAGMTQARRSITGDEVVQFYNDPNKWLLKVSRLVLTKPAPLVTTRDANGNILLGKDKLARQGMLEMTVEQMKMDKGGTEILRQDTVNLADGSSAGLIAARYQAPEGTRLTQRAIIQGGDQLYYIVEFVTPAPRDGDISADPQVQQAVDLFNKVLDSVRLLDQSKLTEEKNQRLYRTRAFFANLTPTRVRGALVPHQWLRLIKDGKDIGYTYIIEEEAQDLPRSANGAVAPVRPGGADGVRIGVRSRTLNAPGDQVDAESWMWVAIDRKHEVWSSIVHSQTKEGLEKYGEFGSSDLQIKRVVDPNLKPGEKLPNGQVDARQPPVREQEIYALSVTPINVRGRNQPVRRDLPAFYIPQALAHMLPRLLPRWEAKGYVFASYVPDEQTVVLRYVDVGHEEDVMLAGQKIVAIPITDRLGYEGSITTHYISPEGKYLGSVNEDTKITVLPSDSATLENLWKSANLTRPGDVEPQTK